MEYLRKVLCLSLLLLSASDAYQGDENISSLLKQLEEELVQGAEPECEDLFRTDLNQIIQTTKSLENKALFLDSPMEVVDQETCLETCCATDGCDTAVYESGAGSADSSRNCYLFSCQGRCFFASHSGYLSMTKRDPGDLEPLPAEPGMESEEMNRPVTTVPTIKAVTTHRVPSTKRPPPPTTRPQTQKPQTVPVPEPTEPHVVELQTVKVEVPEPVHPVVVQPAVQPQPQPVRPTECKRWEFQCDDGSCIHMAYVCDNLYQCMDGSDEEVCQGEPPVEPELVCEPVRCRMYCAYGWDTDSRGCEICKCKFPDFLSTTVEPVYGGRLVTVAPTKAATHGKPHHTSSKHHSTKHTLPPKPVLPIKQKPFITEEPPFGNGSPDTPESVDKSQQQPRVKSTQPPKPAEKTAKAAAAAPAPQGKPGVQVAVVEVNISHEKGVPAAPNPATSPPEAQHGKAEPPTNQEATQSKKGLNATPSHLAPESGAVLPLALGLAVTALLLLVVGCRLRQVKGRLKYGRSLATNAEADYLINGMYL
ncbi:PREDICTED: low-density lipoprotein receptor-related protein 11-like isoform X2 [Branchiostoma belcheri]|uniref:Low-density lipoprotein receptor-related protein 11-like isoform X2 n=1 Tax=Branchiostoma belcheri TaxID=7741 RepID=A0A6P4Y8T2_BRABE|nr:PREDICTED: low-density lipoprotein receptor-related protein 11-like isoform X2 [Branchiostoma belcheri]